MLAIGELKQDPLRIIPLNLGELIHAGITGVHWTVPGFDSPVANDSGTWGGAA